MFQSRFHIVSLFVMILLVHVIAGVYFNGYAPWWVGLIILIYLGLLVLGSIFIRWNFYLRSQLKIPPFQVQLQGGKLDILPNHKTVALTFDDGPGPHTGTILDILKQNKIPATFFLIGDHISGRESLVKRMQTEGHAIGNHSRRHGKNFDWQHTEKIMGEIEETNALIAAITGEPPVLFRPPYGVTTPNLAKALRRIGMKSVAWTIRSFDTVARSEERLLQRILSKLKPGAIILLHDHGPLTAKILPQLIAGIRDKGYEFQGL